MNAFHLLRFELHEGRSSDCLFMLQLSSSLVQSRKHSRDFYWINHEWIKHNGDTKHFRWKCKGNKSMSNMFGMDPTQHLVRQCAFHRTYRKTFRKGRRLWGICHFDRNWSSVCLFCIKDHGASSMLGQLCTIELHSQLKKFCGSQSFFYLFWFQDS